MTINRLDDKIEDRIRLALGRKFSTYKRFKLIDEWQTDHAKFTRFHLSKPRRKKKGKKGKKGGLITAVAKCFVPSSSNDPMYSLSHNPGSLYHREKINLGAIATVFQGTGLRKSPHFYGSFDNGQLLITEDLGKLNKNNELMVAVRINDQKNIETIFLEGLKTVACFDGVCNQRKSVLEATYDYAGDIKIYQMARLAVLKENFTRIFFNNNSKCREQLEEKYDHRKVKEFIQSKKKIDLESRLADIATLREGLNEEQIFQHNDCNGLNIVNDKLVDFEDFGYGSWTNDISGYCIIVGLGNNAIFSSDQFSFYRHVYLADEHAYETIDAQDKERIKRTIGDLSKLKNGDLKTHIGTKVMAGNDKRYADWTFSFFANAIDKNLQLAASYDRYGEEQRKDYAEKGSDVERPILGSDPKYIRELFSAVAELNDKIGQCTNPESVREYFHAYGSLFLELGLYNNTKEKTLLEEALKGIKGGTIAGNVSKDWPAF